MIATISFICNEKTISEEVNPAITLLDFLRKELHLTGTKEGCHEGDCGACIVLIGTSINDSVTYKSVNSCLLPMAAVNGKHIITIEGLTIGGELNPVQRIMVEEGGTQCGFCTPGFIISMTGYFLTNKEYTSQELIESIDGNICRCTGHFSIKRAASKVTDFINSKSIEQTSSLLIPEWFNDIPQRLKELKIKKSKKPGLTSDKKTFIVSGGTDLYVQKWEEIYRSEINYLQDNRKSKTAYVNGNDIAVSSAATVTNLMNSDILNSLFPDIKNYFKLFGSTPIRNRATVGGNIVNASPIGDITSFFLALNSRLVIIGGKSERVVYLKDFYLGYKTLDKKPEEIIKSVIFKIPESNSLFSFEKVSRRTYLDIASVNSSMYIETDNNIIININISAGGVAPVPLYLIKTRDYLLNEEISPDLIAHAVKIAQSESSPISDARGSADYKKLLLGQLLLAHFLKLFPQLQYEDLYEKL